VVRSYPELASTIFYFGGEDTAVANVTELAHEVNKVDLGKVVDRSRCPSRLG